MWAWAPLLLLTSYQQAGLSEQLARLAGFVTIASGAGGSIVAGLLADRLGRTRIAMTSLLISGSCALLVGFALDVPLLLTGVALIWGFAVVADSAQFSAAVSELCDQRYIGTALTMQTCLGFLLTTVSIRTIPWLVDMVGWRWAFMALALGPAVGVWSMRRLRSMPQAKLMASGAG
jgi:MFS family permease